MAYCKRGFVIVDISQELKEPPRGLPTNFWPTVVLTSPDVNHYDSWMKDRNGKLIYVNCDDERDLKAFVAWQKLFPLGQDAGITDELCKEISDEWKRVKQRIEQVGPLPRFVFSRGSFGPRFVELDNAIDGITLNNKAQYMGILRMDSEWKPDHASHKLVKLVRVREDLNMRHTGVFPFHRIYTKE
ncbi:putative Retrotransposon hot spot protein [Trypanosoma vivax]|nr:putative Retrotransposon hot spot protein [Trypanosoma vivax]